MMTVQFQFCIARKKLRGNVHHQTAVNPPVSVAYTAPTVIVQQPVHNNFPNTRHVSPSTLVVEQRLNQHYAAQNQAPPYYPSDNLNQNLSDQR